MKPYPHRYEVWATAQARGRVRLKAQGLPDLVTDAAPAHGGPGDAWSPGALLVGAAVDCYTLAFRIVANASGFEFHELACHGEGVIDAAEDSARLVSLALNAHLIMSEGGARRSRAERLLQKAKQNCLITNSLRAAVSLHTQITEQA